ncbi:hypothetical protein C0995_016347 [Termitomyces sp. Mi166|nr:hypothetical protein C0995_016347 [Termitomyces sp. Mi166\
MQAEEEQIKQIEGMFERMFCSYKANIKNLHGYVNDFSATVSAIFKGLQKTQMEVQQEAQGSQDDIKALKNVVELFSAGFTTRNKSTPPLADATSPPTQQGQASLPFPAHPSLLVPIFEDNKATRSTLPSASTSMSNARSILNSNPASAAATGSALSPDSAATTTAQSTSSARSSPPVANPLSVPPTTTATMTPTTEHGLILSATTATMTSTTECGWRLFSGEEPEPKQMKDRE